MAESEGSESGSILSPNALMALFTLIGGVFLASHKLSSDRPAKAAVEGTRPLGIQNIESRLWEDPFAAWDKLSEANQHLRADAGLTNMVEALAADFSPLNSSNLLVLGVMVSGQPYAEDTEGRIRTRYAVGAALGSGGYKPSHAGHIGMAASHWPSTKELNRWRFNTNAELRIGGRKEASAPAESADENPDRCQAEDEGLHLHLPFEEYQPREYFSRREHGYPTNLPVVPAHYGRVLLVWLDEEYFEDDPAARLALFKGEMSALLPPEVTNHVDWAVIGPRNSSTLRDLLKSEEVIKTTCTNLPLWGKITGELGKVRLLLATPTVMDEAVVERTAGVGTGDFAKPRQAVAKALGPGRLFGSVDNFACTDRQLAAEALAKLKLRRIDPAGDRHHHLVLISEWDSFFSRMAGLAYAAEITHPQTSDALTNATNAIRFVNEARGGSNTWPATLHRYVYLQGLDGEVTISDEAKERDPKEKEPGRHRPASLEELTQWSPDANKAEGQAQYDYLGRLGDVLADLDRDLRWQDPDSRVTAVGIIGSDVYDTLLVLQSLRVRLPDAVFFTSDLDARFWHPRELSWSRNLMVVSGYGLRLNDDLQAGVAPFRESAQCAYYLATLASIHDGKFQGTDRVPPRRFEIGRHGAVDLSTNAVDTRTVIWPHPVMRIQPEMRWKPLAGALVVLLAFVLLVFKGLRRLVWRPRHHCCQPLVLSEEDHGGVEGGRVILGRLEQLSRTPDKLVGWLLERDSTAPAAPAFSAGDFRDPLAFATRLRRGGDDFSGFLQSQLPDELKDELLQPRDAEAIRNGVQSGLARELDRMIRQDLIRPAPGFPLEKMRPQTIALLEESKAGGSADLIWLNRMMLEDAYGELVKRGAELRLREKLAALLSKLNLLVFMTGPGALPAREDIRGSALLDAGCRRGLEQSLDRIASHRRLRQGDIRRNREAVNQMLSNLEGAAGSDDPRDATAATARCARTIALMTYDRRRSRPILFWVAAILMGTGLAIGIDWAWKDTYLVPGGEPFNLQGTSAWPTEFIRFAVLALSVVVIVRTQRRLSQSNLDITRRYQLNVKVDGAPESRRWRWFWPKDPGRTEAGVCANEVWGEYQQTRHWLRRLVRVMSGGLLYVLFVGGLFTLAPQPVSPIRGDLLQHLEMPLLLGSVFAYLFGTLWMIDTAVLCSWFIRRLSRAPTRYPEATLGKFLRERALDDDSLVGEWIDLQWIADLTEPIGKLVYWPFLALLLMIVSRNPWLDHWTWHWPLVITFIINMGLAAASYIILQRAASRAREIGVEALKTKLNEKHREAAASVAEHESNQAELLLQEINDLRRGAFAPLSKNPLVGALLVNSSGAILVEIVAQSYLK